MTRESVLKHFFIILMFVVLTTNAFAQTTAFNFQGRLNDGANPANGNFEIQFKLYDALSGGTQIGATVSRPNVAIINGIFAAQLNFGAAAFDGSNRFVEIGVRPAGSANAFNILNPRQAILSTPYTIQAQNAAKLGGVDASEYVTTTTVGNSFIKNATTQQTGNFNINGNGIIGDSLGIGITPSIPSIKLDVNGSALVRTGGSGGNIQFGNPNGETGMTILNTNRADIKFNNSALRLVVGSGTTPPLNSNGITLNTAGNVGIGNTDPQSKLEVNGNAVVTTGGSGGQVIFAAPNGESGMSIIGTSRADIRFDGTTLKLLAGLSTGAPLSNNGIAITREGNIGIGTTTPNAKFQVIGTVRANVLEITNGSDLAEQFEVADGIKPGMVVAINPRQTGRLSIARGAYNRRVAGIISGANNLAAGMVLPDLPGGKKTMPVALTGRVWVYCVAVRNSIKPGDLLTTSNTPGYAMKAANYRRAQGAVIGKAMTSLKKGRGMVLVLVTLQ